MAWAERRTIELREARIAQQKEREWWLHAREVLAERVPQLWKVLTHTIETEVRTFNQQESHVRLELQFTPQSFELYKRPYPTRLLRVELAGRQVQYTVRETVASGYSDVIADGIIRFSLDDHDNVWFELPDRGSEADNGRAAEFLLDLALGVD
jgi:hypothetical protein